MPRLHRHAPLLLAGLLAVTMPARAFNHIGLWPENHLCGPAVRPSELTGRVTVVVDWSIEVPESLAWLKLFNNLAHDYADDEADQGSAHQDVEQLRRGLTYSSDAPLRGDFLVFDKGIDVLKPLFIEGCGG